MGSKRQIGSSPVRAGSRSRAISAALLQTTALAAVEPEDRCTPPDPHHSAVGSRSLQESLLKKKKEGQNSIRYFIKADILMASKNVKNAPHLLVLRNCKLKQDTIIYY